MDEKNADRLRERPEQRFAGPVHVYDLAEVAKRLRGELEAGESGHRQQTLYKHGNTTVSLFLFGHLTRLSAHWAKGIVCIQIIRGHLRITAEGQSHDLRTGQLLVLAPGVEHDLVAPEESEMLLTVSLQSPTGTI
jgi:quercetin dioxygenase-like cupin family protein